MRRNSLKIVSLCIFLHGLEKDIYCSGTENKYIDRFNRSSAS